MKNVIITRNAGWSPLADLRREMDRLFDDFWTAPSTQSSGTGMLSDTAWQPACDVEEEEGHYLLTFEMPGIPRDQIKIEAMDNQITVSGERNHENKKIESGSWYSECRYGKFSRSFTLPAGVDATKVEANYQDGILRVFLPKAESSKPRQIKVTNGVGSTGFFGKLLGQSPKKEQEVLYSSSDKVAERVAS